MSKATERDELVGLAIRHVRASVSYALGVIEDTPDEETGVSTALASLEEARQLVHFPDDAWWKSVTARLLGLFATARDEA